MTEKEKILFKASFKRLWRDRWMRRMGLIETNTITKNRCDGIK